MVGCGVNLVKRKVFFTLNGKVVAEIFKAPLGEDLYPTLCLFFPGDKVSVNFGKGKFMFEYESCYEEIKLRLVEEISKVEINASEMYNVITNYLCFQGFSRTFNALEKKNKYFEDSDLTSDGNRQKKASGDVGRGSLGGSISSRSASRKFSGCNHEEFMVTRDGGRFDLGMVSEKSSRRGKGNLVIEIDDGHEQLAKGDAKLRCGSYDPPGKKKHNDGKVSEGKSVGRGETGPEKISFMWKLPERNDIRELIVNGEIQKATKLIETHFRNAFKKSKYLILALKVQTFFEVARKDDLKGLKFLRSKLKKYFEDQILLLSDGQTTVPKEFTVKVIFWQLNFFLRS